MLFTACVMLNVVLLDGGSLGPSYVGYAGFS
jgi:hypothetical protein